MAIARKGAGHDPGVVDESFQLLPSYLYMLKLNNVGTIVEFESDSESRFKCLFYDNWCMPCWIL